jgi:hypothetical protein
VRKTFLLVTNGDFFVFANERHSSSRLGSFSDDNDDNEEIEKFSCHCLKSIYFSHSYLYRLALIKAVVGVCVKHFHAARSPFYALSLIRWRQSKLLPIKAKNRKCAIQLL